MKSDKTEGRRKRPECLRLFSASSMPRIPEANNLTPSTRRSGTCLGKQPIESLLTFPLLTDPDMQAAMRGCRPFRASLLLPDINLVACPLPHCEHQSEYGETDASAQSYSWFGTTLGAVPRYNSTRYRFDKWPASSREARVRGLQGEDLLPHGEWSSSDTADREATLLTQVRAAFRAGVESGEKPRGGVLPLLASSNHTSTDY